MKPPRIIIRIPNIYIPIDSIAETNAVVRKLGLVALLSWKEEVHVW